MRGCETLNREGKYDIGSDDWDDVESDLTGLLSEVGHVFFDIREEVVLKKLKEYAGE